MNTKRKYAIIVLLIAALVLPLSLARATVDLQFANSSATSINGTTLTFAPGQDITLRLQLVATASELTNGLDYRLTQTAGPVSSVFSITGRNTITIFSASDGTTNGYADGTKPDADVTSSADIYKDDGSTGSGGGPDNLLNPTNDPTLGASKSNTAVNYTGGTHPIALYTIHIDSGAALGLYTIQTSLFNGQGYFATNNPNGTPFDSEASINIQLVPEPATWSLLALGGLGTVGLNLLRRRRVS